MQQKDLHSALNRRDRRPICGGAENERSFSSRLSTGVGQGLRPATTGQQGAPMPRLIPVGAAALFAVLALSACGPKAPAGPDPNAPAQVGVVVVRSEPVTLTAELSGRTSAVLVSEVRPQVGGLIQARLFQEGSNVRAGQPLYQIDPATYRASLNSAIAGLPQAQATAN